VTPLGNSVEETWQGICAGRSGIGTITKFDTTGFKTKIAGELKNFDPLLYLNKKEVRRLDDFIIYAIAAAEMAMADAALTIHSDFTGAHGCHHRLRHRRAGHNWKKRKSSFSVKVRARFPPLRFHPSWQSRVGLRIVRFQAKGPIKLFRDRLRCRLQMPLVMPSESSPTIMPMS